MDNKELNETVETPDTEQNTTNINEKANLFLGALIDEVDPGFSPLEDKEWAEAFIESIRRFREKDNFRHSKEAERATKRLGRQAAADEHRFFWEFWQNADDAQASNIVFSIGSDRMIISNNGNPFNALNVYSLVFVASTTKGSRADLMGKFGVGHLSLMRFSDSPIYHSGNYAFKLERSFTYPSVIKEFADRYFNGTEVIAPLKPGVDPQKLFEALAKRIESETLLYMKYLTKVIVRNLVDGSEKVINIDPEPCGNGDIVTIGSQKWLRFIDDKVIPPIGMCRDDGTEVKGKLTITLVRKIPMDNRHPVCAYFPTQQYHSYPWKFSAPFDVTTARENLIPCDFNRWLLRETGRRMVEAAISLGIGSPSQPWDLVPLKGEDDELLNQVWIGAEEEMKSKAWLPTRKGFIHPTEAAFAETQEIKQLVNYSDLKLLGANRTWLTSIPPEDARPVLQSLGVMRVCCHVMSKILANGPKRKPKWYLRAIASIIEVKRTIGDKEVDERLLEGKCILAQNGKSTSLASIGRTGRLVCNARSENLAKELGSLFPNRLVMMLHKIYRQTDGKKKSLEDKLRQTVDEWLKLTATDETFSYETRFDASAFIKRFIISGLPNSNQGITTDKYINFVRDHVEAYISDQGLHRRNEIFQELGKILLVKAHTKTANGKVATDYRLISETYIPSGFIDKSSWSKAAKGVPELWWIDWHYRKSLVRKGNPLSVVTFLKDLGAATCPRIHEIDCDSSHNVHKFKAITRGDSSRYPNFPHSKVGFMEYSQCGLVDDSQSPDLIAWITYTRGLKIKERAERGEALLRTFEENWDYYKNMSSATATGYYNNARYDISKVPSNWLWQLQNTDWVLASIKSPLSKSDFVKPKETFALTEKTRELVQPKENSLCRWEANSIEVAMELGFIIDIPADILISYLKTARTNDYHPPALKYYDYLSKDEAISPKTDVELGEGLLFAPCKSKKWWRSDECLRTMQKEIFGDYCGYLNIYSSAEKLWERLGIAKTPDLDFLVQFWTRMSKQESAESQDLNLMLDATYLFSENLLSGSNRDVTDIPLVAESGWRTSSQVYFTDFNEVAEELKSRGYYRWDYKFPDLVPSFQRWAGILNVEHEAEIKVISTKNIPDSVLEQKLHKGVLSFASEVSRVYKDLWPTLRPRLHNIIRGRVQRVEPLKIRIKLSGEKIGNISCQVAISAYHKDGNIFVSGLTKLSDKSVAKCILNGLPLGGQARQNMMNSLLVHLADDSASDEGSPPPFDEDVPKEPIGSDLWGKPHIGANNNKPGTIVPGKKKEPLSRHVTSPIPAYPVEEYEVESDEGGDDPSA